MNVLARIFYVFMCNQTSFGYAPPWISMYPIIYDSYKTNDSPRSSSVISCSIFI